MTNCRGCGREIVWAINQATGAKVPLDAAAHYYRIVREDATGDRHASRVDPLESRVYVSHFQTCPKANEFSRSKRNT